MGAINYIWDEENDSLLEEVDDDGNVIASYTNEPSQFGKVISQERNGVTSYYHYDGQGNTVALTDDNENVTDTYIYSAFGELVSSTGTTVNPFRYVGQYGYYTDVETNDIYIRARSYAPTLGRWLTRDPIGFKGGSLSLSEYCGGHPLSNIDPSGFAVADLDPAIANFAPWCRVGLRYQYYLDENRMPITSPRDYDPVRGLPENVLGNSDPDEYRTECVCTCCDPKMCDRTKRVVCRAIYRGRIRLSPTAIQITPRRVGATLSGSYGHEQRHVQNLIKGAQAAADLMSMEESKFGCVSESKCPGLALTIQSVGQVIMNNWLQRESDHGQRPDGSVPRDYEPQKGVMYNPLSGGMPPAPTCPPLKAIAPMDTTPCSN